MRIELNLATRPTENLRRFYVLGIAGVAVLLVLTVVQLALFVRNWSGGRDVSRGTAEVRRELGGLEIDQRKLEASLKQPEARDIMVRSWFLNSLILQKSISWTQIFMDLEGLIPNDVQVLSIRPEVQESNEVLLEMSVAGKSTAPLLEFLKRIEDSDKFGTPVLSTEVPPGLGAQDTSTRLNMTVLYVQK